MSAIIIGATGLVGTQILKAAEASSSITQITTLTRGKVTGSDKLNSIVKASTDEWYPEIKSLKDTDYFFSAFGTTRAKAGGLKQFKEIDYGTNLKSAQAAKEANIKTFVLVSCGGTSSSSYFPYLRIKGELEDEIIKLGFQRLIIFKPGALLGERGQSHGWANAVINKLGVMTRGTIFSGVLRPVYAEEIGKVAVSLASQPLPAEKEVREVEADEIVALAKEL